MSFYLFYNSKVKNKTRNTNVLKDSRSLYRLHFTNIYFIVLFQIKRENTHILNPDPSIKSITFLVLTETTPFIGTQFYSWLLYFAEKSPHYKSCIIHFTFKWTESEN